MPTKHIKNEMVNERAEINEIERCDIEDEGQKLVEKINGGKGRLGKRDPICGDRKDFTMGGEHTV